MGKVKRVRVDPGNSTRIEIDIAVDKDAPLKTDSVAKISTLGPLTDNYIEISTGSEGAALAPPGSVLQSAEAFGLPQLGDAAQAMLPDIQKALQKLNQNLDGLQVTIARANDLLNDRNRANIASSLSNVDHLVADARPKVTGVPRQPEWPAERRASQSVRQPHQRAGAYDQTVAAAGRSQNHHRPRQRHAGACGFHADGESRRTFAPR